MKAVIYKSYGGPEMIKTIDLPKQEVPSGKILIRVHCSSVNPIDWKIASGKYWPILRANFPQIPGFDVSGEVVSCGPGIQGFKSGDRIHACLADSGAAAEYCLATPDMIAHMPETMDFPTAAGLPLAGMTALQGLRDKGGMPLQNSNQRILVIGASGGVGHFAIQIAHAAGATVIGVCSARNLDMVKSLGANQVIDYSSPNPYKDLASCDIIFDCVGQPSAQWLNHLKSGGRFISTIPTPSLMLCGFNPCSDKKVGAIFLKANSDDLRILDDLYRAGKLIAVTKHFPLEEMKEAWELSISGRSIGKIIIDIHKDALSDAKNQELR